MKKIHVLIVCALVFLTATLAHAQYQIIGSNSTQLQGGVVRTETAVQDGVNPLNQFRITRLVRNVPPSFLRGAILLVPSLGVDFTLYEQTDPPRGLGSSIAGFFALRNFDVYGYSSRGNGLPAGTCEAGVLDCSVMQTWNMQTLVDDIDFVRSQIELTNPGTEVYIGGLSLGGIATIAVLDANPNDYDGAFIWEGMLASPDPQVQALNQAYCAGLEAQLAAGLFFDGVGSNVLKKTVKLSDVNPTGLTTVPLFPPFLTNHQVLVSLFSQVTPGPVSQPVPDYILLAGSVAEDRLFFASEKRLAENVARFNDYAPTALVRDISCSLAGIETTYTDNLASYTGPILGIGGGRGFGAFLAGNLALFGSTDVELLIEPEFGHVDHLFVPNRRDFIERPILRWIRRISH